MLRCLVAPGEGITAVAVESTDPNGLDDVVVYRSDSITYYQLKHTVDSDGRFTGGDLFGTTDGEIALVAKLYRGWERARNDAGSRQIEIRVHTNASGSTHHANLLIPPAELDQRVLQRIRRGEWPLDQEAGLLEDIRTRVGAPDLETLREFLGALRLDFQAPDEGVIKQEVIAGLQNYLHRSPSHVEADAEAWLGRIYDLATRYGGGHPLSKSEIERQLRQLLNAPRLVEHRLALPEHHVPREIVAAEILDLARGIEQGYLLVMGQPGCGKTTLATWFANEHDDELLMRYHVFDPRQSSGRQIRERASDLGLVRSMSDVLSERFPLTVGVRVPAEDQLGGTIDSLYLDLEQLASGGQTRFVIIDGIDHIVRLRLDSDSLFEALPRENHPAGVVFILFGQPDWDYPEWLLQRAQTHTLPPFSAEETLTHVCQRFGWESATPGVAPLSDLLQDRTQGNPLSLFYNLFTVAGLVEEHGDSLEAILEALQIESLFGSFPHEEYDRLLDGLKSQRKVPDDSQTLWDELLACMAVATAAITPERLSHAFTDDGMMTRQSRDFLEALRPVVVERSPGEFRLFHDDFRRYLEERTNDVTRPIAHHRLAMALMLDWKGDELSSLAEHAWAGGDHACLAELPFQRELATWFQAASAYVVVDFYRLAFAAAFMLGNEITIMRNAFAAALALEIADLPQSFGQPPLALGLRGWSFVAPPREVESDTLRRRVPAIQAAASSFKDDPHLAAEIANRFLIPMETLESIVQGDWHAEREYLEALTRWFFKSGNLMQVATLLNLEVVSPYVASAIGSALANESDEEVVQQWAHSFAGVNERLDRELITAAVLQLRDGNTNHAAILASLLAEREVTSERVRRDAKVLLKLVGSDVQFLPEMTALLIWFDLDAIGSEALGRVELFFHGFVTTASGLCMEMATCSFPDRFRKPLMDRHEAEQHIQTLNVIWRTGCAAGLAATGDDLLSPRDLLDVVRALLGFGVPQDSFFASRHLRLCADLYLPLLARAVASIDALARAMIEELFRWIDAHLAHPTERLYGALEALWLLAPENWIVLAQRALAEQFLPGTDWSERSAWFEYWEAMANERAVTVPEVFISRATYSRLGVPRKTYPAELAVDLVCDAPDHPAIMERLRRLTALLIRLDGEPEGGRGAYRHLSRVLAVALRVNPVLFEAQFKRCVLEHALTEPFGSLPGDIVEEVIKNPSSLIADELVVLWHWIAASPGSFEWDNYDHASRDVKTTESIAQRLEEIGAEADAELLRRWLPALMPPERSISKNDNGSRFASEERRIPLIEEIDLTWFAPWYDRGQYQVLQDYLATNGDQGWRTICTTVAARIARSNSALGYGALAVAESMVDLRSNTSPDEALELAFWYAEAKVQFQPVPAPGEESPAQASIGLEAILRLIARGLDVGDVETVRRTLRSIAALIRRPGTCSAMTSEVATRLNSDDDRSSIYALALLREAQALPEAGLEAVQSFQAHPNAWCRWYACSILGVEPVWDEPRRIETRPGIAVPELPPTRSTVGASFFGDTTGTRERFVAQLLMLLPSSIGEEALRGWLEAELRALPVAPGRPHGWHSLRGGHQLSPTGVGSAAARLVSRLASQVPFDRVPVLLAAVARFDPWLALADPVLEPPIGWIELCRTEQSFSRDQVVCVHQSLGLVPTDSLVGPEAADPEVIGRVASDFLFPERPKRYPWVAESWEGVGAPQMREGPVIPLAFMNRPFMEVQVAQFDLVPMFGWPPFQELVFQVHPTPRWVHPELGPVIVAACSESQAESSRLDRHVNWWAGWYASPEWLAALVESGASVIRFWRIESAEVRHGEVGPSSVEYGLEELPGTAKT